MLFILYFSSFNDIETSANFFLEKYFYESSILKYVTPLFNKNIRHLPISLDNSRVKSATAARWSLFWILLFCFFCRFVSLFYPWLHLFSCDMFIPGCQWVEIEENCERFAASTKRKFLSLVILLRIMAWILLSDYVKGSNVIWILKGAIFHL